MIRMVQKLLHGTKIFITAFSKEICKQNNLLKIIPLVAYLKYPFAVFKDEFLNSFGGKMLDTNTNKVLFEITAVPRTKTKRMPANITLVTRNTDFQNSTSDDVTLSSDASRNTSHLFVLLKKISQRLFYWHRFST